MHSHFVAGKPRFAAAGEPWASKPSAGQRSQSLRAIFSGLPKARLPTGGLPAARVSAVGSRAERSEGLPPRTRRLRRRPIPRHLHHVDFRDVRRGIDAAQLDAHEVERIAAFVKMQDRAAVFFPGDAR